MKSSPKVMTSKHSGIRVRLMDRRGKRFIVQADRPVSHMGAGKHLAKSKPLSPERIPSDEWESNH